MMTCENNETDVIHVNNGTGVMNANNDHIGISHFRALYQLSYINIAACFHRYFELLYRAR